ncbi:tetratricopeptide repeat protein [Streptomyces sp. NPDC059255]|uniref:tetratricopeptide repeat protein n=1 Tax=Streptomyces sp. NPDC059255 TaxID=3346793 RepID=UPI0036CA6FCE
MTRQSARRDGSAKRLGRFDEAVEQLRRALTVLRATGNHWVEGETLDHFGEVLLVEGRTEEARARWRQALKIFEEIDHPDTARLKSDFVLTGT